MMTLLYYLIGLIIIGVIIFAFIALSLGREAKAEAIENRSTLVSIPQSGEVHEDDLKNMKFRVEARGYNQQEVDWVLARTGTYISFLEKQVTSNNSSSTVETKTTKTTNSQEFGQINATHEKHGDTTDSQSLGLIDSTLNNDKDSESSNLTKSSVNKTTAPKATTSKTTAPKTTVRKTTAPKTGTPKTATTRATTSKPRTTKTATTGSGAKSSTSKPRTTKTGSNTSGSSGTANGLDYLTHTYLEENKNK